MTVYYQDDFATIYHGDSSAILPELGRFDLLLTDPPYGLGTEKIVQGGGGRREFYGPTDWDDAPVSKELLDACRAAADHAVIWGGNYFELPISRGWLFWDKDERLGRFSDGELAWTTRDNALRKITLPWGGWRTENKQKRIHPTQKPVALMDWCLGFFPQVETVLDPFMGSGATLIAAKRRGLKVVGIEKEERYCEPAARLLEQTLPMFAKPAK